MNIAIIDAEIIGKSKHRFPNLACMKISSYCKSKGFNVELKLDYDNLHEYDKVFISKVFVKTNIPKEPNNIVKNELNCFEFYKDNAILNLPNVEFGGTGFYYDKAEPLPYEIEHCKPDYHLYDEWIQNCINNGAKEKEFTYYKNYSIGFTTRGCFRQCKFCVNKNYTKCQPHSKISEFIDIDRPKLCFLDDNFFACSDWKSIISEIKDTKKKFQFKQGLDERLLTEEKIHELSSWKYDGDYIFAFDNIEDKSLIEEKAKLIRSIYKNKGQNIKFYVFCGFDRDNVYDENFWIKDIEDIFERIFLLSKYNFKPYIMRHENYKDSPYRGTYINLAMWCNQPSLFSNHSYKQICIKDDNRKGGKRLSATYRYYLELLNKYPDIESKYFNILPNDLIIR